MGRRGRRQKAPETSGRPGAARWRAILAAAAFAALAGGGIFVLLHRQPRTDAEARARIAGRRPSPSELNLVFVTLDTMRADHLGCYGFRSVDTSNIDGLASEGVLFEHATAPVPLTFPSHSTIFTGLLPPHHGVRDNGGFFLEDDKTTLAERLKGAGYTTGAFIGAWVLESRWGLAQGFDEYSDKFDLSQYKILSLGTVQKRGDEVMDNALAWVDTVKDRKFFAWVHLYDAHAPYDPPEPYRSRYRGQPYAGEVAYVDHVVGRLVEYLRQNGLLEKSLIVITGDHGESLGEHSESTHAYFIYNSTTAVPLIVRTPWGYRGRSRTRVSLADLFPTVLDLLGLPPEPGIDGRSLARAVLDPSADLGHVAYSETYFPRYHFGWQQLRSLRDGAYTFIDAPQPELYDLARDPKEATNIYKANSKRGVAMRERLEALVHETGETAPERKTLDPETLQRLAALGYVGTTVDVDPKAILPDPKEKLAVFVLMNQAKAAAQEDKLTEAVTKMQRVLAQDPEIMDAWLTLGIWLTREGRTEEAIEAYKRALALKPDDEVAMLDLANAYRSRGRTGDAAAALEIFRGGLKANPRNPQAWYQLATLYLDLGREKDAETTFREALKANPKMGAAYNALGALAYQRGDLQSAERLVRQGLELEADVRTGRFNLARILEDRGQLDAAEKLYRSELDTYPDHGRAHFNLAQLLRQRGDRQGYLAELKRGTEQAPKFGACYFYLAREALGAGQIADAADLAQRGLEAEPGSPLAALGHYVLADVYNRRGDEPKSRAEADEARRLEAGQRANPEPRL
jgi:arylsulfatase A-like enzyme/Tfp pilus assembly protein PilF